MKTSLGRRSSSRNPVRMMTFTDFESARKEKKSSIPVRRAHSVERKLGMATPVGKRSCSEDRNSMLVTPATSRKTFGTERPSRTTTMSTNSTRLSSFGGARTMRDCRTIEDKDWQINAQRKIEKFLIEDPEGCSILSNGSIRPLTLKLFIDVVDLLLRRIINAGQDSYINKTNYITELPYIMKKLLYRGKIEKSWLISVNTSRSWCHALACMDFLVSMICTQMVVDPTSLMYPETSCKEDGDIWDYKLLLPYVQESFELFTSGTTNYDEVQAALDQRFVEMHLSNDVFHHINELKEEIQKIEQQCEEYKARIQNEKPALHELGMTYNNLKDTRAQNENKLRNLAIFEEDLKNKIKKKEKERNALRETLLKKQQEKYEIESVVSSQEISPQEIEKLKQRRDSLQREIEAEQKYLNTYNELVMKSSMEVLALKKKNAGLIQDFNIALLNHLSFGLENVPLTGKMDSDDEKTLDAIEKAIIAAKNTLQTASGYCSDASINKAQEERDLIEKQVIEERNKLTLYTEKLKTSIFEKEEVIKRLKNEVESITKKIIELESDPNEENLIEERKIRAKKMSEQLDIFRQNSVYYLQKSGIYFSEHEKKMKALKERYQELEKECKQ
ncbi:kinetochore protein NDC80 homolog [Halyomorpha halys]|uniref:kinetochore protein NDC80 homolog n=1 Tax=Halyomorpha halys TaxID=286706 RepID=UPI0006D4CD6D|nr:probable kinetochore protein NDC80 [Halyomorpha halys]